MNCPKCGAPNVFGAARCEYCGSTLPEFPNDESEMISRSVPLSLEQRYPSARVKKKDTVSDLLDPLGSIFTGGCLSYIGWIFCFPLMLTRIAANRETSLGRWIWWTVTFFGWIFYLGMGIAVLRGDSPNQQPMNSVEISTITEAATLESTARVEIEDPERAELIRKSCALRLSNRQTLSVSDPKHCPLLVRFSKTGHAQTIRVVLSQDDKRTVIPLILDYIRDLSDTEPDGDTLAEFAELMRGDGTLAREGEKRFGLKIFRLNCIDNSSDPCRMSITIQKPK